MPRITTAFVSKYQRTRVHRSEFSRSEKFSLVANLAGCLASAATISTAVWQVTETSSIILGAGSKTATTCTVSVTAGIGYGGVVKLTVTASDGAIFVQLYDITVLDSPWYSGDVAAAAGSASVTA